MALLSPTRLQGVDHLDAGLIQANFRAIQETLQNIYTSVLLIEARSQAAATIAALTQTVPNAPAQTTQTISSPPTQAEVIALRNKINEIIVAMTNAQLQTTDAKINEILTALKTSITTEK